MSMLGKTDSEATSMAASSPARSPLRRPVYYVQSPSHDGEKTNNSFHSSPGVLSPTASPPHSTSSVGPRSSSTRFSVSLNTDACCKITPTSAANANGKSLRIPWKDFGAIEEERLIDDYDDSNPRGLPRRCYVLCFVVGFTVLFSLFSLILWGASRAQKPEIAVESITFDRFTIQAGTDYSGVATDMVSMNSTVKLAFKNTATFFGVHVTSTPLDLIFLSLTVATGTVNEFYQPRKSQRAIAVNLVGSYVPLYGGGQSLSSSGGVATVSVPMVLGFVVRSRGYVLGTLVKSKFYTRVECAVHLDPKKMGVSISLGKACTFE